MLNILLFIFIVLSLSVTFVFFITLFKETTDIYSKRIFYIISSIELIWGLTLLLILITFKM